LFGAAHEWLVSGDCSGGELDCGAVSVFGGQALPSEAAGYGFFAGQRRAG
jgi:hypothetical protein